ncbi:MAG: ChbG/HpnK family deacetylase [Balneolaceae bacterium]|nr:ChbG/HpnK family deacetylase [Balneolaceae bacterium]
MKKKRLLPAVFVLLFTIISLSPVYGQSPGDAVSEDSTFLIIRTDDLGMSHAVNMALEELLATGMPVTASVMFPCPWYQEAVEILKKYEGENLSVGIHLTLNSEWQHYRWGPVAGRSAVSSLVDENGYFFHSSSDLYKNNPRRDEVETEIRAQIERAMASGLDIDYVDYHMGTVSRDSMMMSVTEQLAEEYGLALWGYFPSKQWYNHYRAEPADKVDSLTASVRQMGSGYNHFVTHVGIDNAELGAMKDMNNSSPLASMSAHRQGELNALTSDAFASALQENGITLVTLRKLINEVGLENMKAPSGN